MITPARGSALSLDCEKSVRSKNDWMPDNLWRQVKSHMPVPCVDVIVQNPRGEILLGWRKIPPYKNTWALPGGRLRRGEDLQAAGRRILADYYLTVDDFFLVGVFPISFPSRSDIPICVATKHFAGEPKPEGREFSNFQWTKKLPNRLGTNYRRMIKRWRQMTRKRQILRFNRL